MKATTTILELALWKDKLNEIEKDSLEAEAKKAEIDGESKRKERHITRGASKYRDQECCTFSRTTELSSNFIQCPIDIVCKI